MGHEIWDKLKEGLGFQVFRVSGFNARLTSSPPRPAALMRSSKARRASAPSASGAGRAHSVTPVSTPNSSAPAACSHALIQGCSRGGLG